MTGEKIPQHIQGVSAEPVRTKHNGHPKVAVVPEQLLPGRHAGAHA